MYSPIRESPTSALRISHHWPPTPSIGPLYSKVCSPPDSPKSEYSGHLSIEVPPTNPAFEQSRFSPVTPPDRTSTIGRLIFHPYFRNSRRIDPENGPARESMLGAQSLSPLSRLSAILQGSRRTDLPIQEAPPVVLSPPPEPTTEAPSRTDFERESDTPDARSVDLLPTRTREWYSLALRFASMIFTLYLFANVIVLNVRSFSPSHASSGLLARPTDTPVSIPTMTIPIATTATSASTPGSTEQCLAENA